MVAKAYQFQASITLTVYSSVVSTTASPLVTCSRPEGSTAKCTLSFGAFAYFAVAASMPAGSALKCQTFLCQCSHLACFDSSHSQAEFHFCKPGRSLPHLNTAGATPMCFA